MMRRHVMSLLLAVLPMGFLMVMIIAPLWAILHYGEGARLWGEVWADDFYRHRLGWTVFQAAVSSVLAVILALPMGWTLARLQFWGREGWLKWLMLPFMMPTLVAGMGVLALFGEQGMMWRGWQDTPYLLIYGNLFFNLPVAVVAAQQGFEAVPVHRLAAARSLGANAWQRFYYVELPVLRTWLLGAMCLIFLYCFSGFGLALLLGGQRYATVEVEIYQLIAYELDMNRAAVLVCLVLAVTLVVGGLYAGLSRTHHAPIRGKLPEPPRNRQQKVVLWVSWGLWVVFCVLPLLMLVVQSVRWGASWRVLWDDETWLAVGNTLRFTAMTMLSAAILGLSHAALARRLVWIRGMTFLPFMVSPVCLAFGVLLLYPEWADSWYLLMALYALLGYPFVAKDVLAAWDALPEHYTQAARLCGANGIQVVCWVILPLLRPALRRGVMFAAATSIGEFAATLFLSRPEWLTLTTLIYQKLGRVGAENYHHALILTMLLMLLAMLVFGAMGKGRAE